MNSTTSFFEKFENDGVFRQISSTEQSMVKNRLGFCDILTIPVFWVDKMFNFKVTTLEYLEIAPGQIFLHFRKRNGS